MAVATAERIQICESDFGVVGKAETASKPMSVVSLFSGCGGMDLGFVGGFEFLGNSYAKTGFEVIWANEISESACKTTAGIFQTT